MSYQIFDAVGALNIGTTTATSLLEGNAANTTAITLTTTTAGTYTLTQGTVQAAKISTGGTFLGNNAGTSNTGSGVTAVGVDALKSSNSGLNITAFGKQALQLNSSASFNTGVGLNALGACTTSPSNTAVGNGAGQTVATGTGGNTCVGAGADVDSATAFGRVAIGSGVTASANNGVFFSGAMALVTAGNTLNFSAGQIGPTTSSRRWKKEITDIEIDSALIYQLRPVSFTWNVVDQPNTRDFGLIAEEVNDIIPMMTPLDTLGIPNGVHYDRLSVLLLAEVKRLKERLDGLESKSAA